MRGVSMESRIAVISIIVENSDSVECLNRILHEFGIYIIGRMGIPYHEKQMNIISVVMDAPQEKVSALSGKLGMIPGVSTKCLYAPDAQKAPK
jgi:putative iron-only hydrogenase system regulator